MKRCKLVVFALPLLAAAPAGADAPRRGVPSGCDPSVMSDAYWQMWNDGEQAKIDADIEKFRKADTVVAVDAPDGTEVEVEQVSHAFFFGAHIFNFNQLGKKEWNDRYKELFGSLFNSATVAFYWRTLERHPFVFRFAEQYEDTEDFWNSCPHPKEQPHWRRPAVDPVISFLRTRGVRIHGHPLVWGNPEWQVPSWLWEEFCPESEKRALEEASGAALPRHDWRVPMGVKESPWWAQWEIVWNEKIYKRLGEDEIAKLAPRYVRALGEFQDRRIREIAARYGDRVDSWDVVNESAGDFAMFGCRAVRRKAFDKSGYGPMPADYAYRAFKVAESCLPKSALLNLNDYNTTETFPMQAKDLEREGARVDVVGAQMHLFDPAESLNVAAGKISEKNYPKVHPAGVAERFDVLSRAGKPIHLSEITITAPDISPRGQMIQAIILHDLYRKWFSVEKMAGITWWNVVDDCGAVGEPSISGLFTRDMRPKTAYFALDDLINREWKTKTTVKAKDGKVAFRGFKGRYRLSWTSGNADKRRSRDVWLTGDNVQ